MSIKSTLAFYIGLASALSLMALSSATASPGSALPAPSPEPALPAASESQPNLPPPQTPQVPSPELPYFGLHWSRQELHPIRWIAAAAPGVCCWGSDFGKAIYTADILSGTPMWQQMLPASVWAEPLIKDNLLVTVSADQSLSGCNFETGQLLFRRLPMPYDLLFKDTQNGSNEEQEHSLATLNSLLKNPQSEVTPTAPSPQDQVEASSKNPSVPLMRNWFKQSDIPHRPWPPSLSQPITFDDKLVWLSVRGFITILEQNGRVSSRQPLAQPGSGQFFATSPILYGDKNLQLIIACSRNGQLCVTNINNSKAGSLSTTVKSPGQTSRHREFLTAPQKFSFRSLTPTRVNGPAALRAAQEERGFLLTAVNGDTFAFRLVSSEKLSMQGRQRALNYQVPQLIWHRSFANPESIQANSLGFLICRPLCSVDSPYIYMACRDKVFCLAADNGRTIWYSRPGTALASAPAIWNGCLLVASENSRMLVYNRFNGKFLGSFKMPGIPSAPLKVWQNYLLSGYDSGRIDCLKILVNGSNN